jgi:hypothetical protein
LGRGDLEYHGISIQSERGRCILYLLTALHNVLLLELQRCPELAEALVGPALGTAGLRVPKRADLGLDEAALETAWELREAVAWGLSVESGQLGASARSPSHVARVHSVYFHRDWKSRSGLNARKAGENESGQARKSTKRRKAEEVRRHAVM